MPQSNVSRSRWMLVWIAVTCVAPVIAACLAYYVFKPVSRTANSGVLIESQQAIPSDLILWEEKDRKISKISLNALRGRWLMLSVDTSACAQHCVKKLYFMRQIRAAQGRERSRILNVWIRTDDAPVSPILQRAYREIRVLIADAPARLQLAQWLPVDTGKTDTEAIYLIDPNGHLMMRFPAHLTPNKIQKDLAHLLKWSGSG